MCTSHDRIVVTEIMCTLHVRTPVTYESCARHMIKQPVYPSQIVALPYLYETISGIIDTIYNDKRTVELDVEVLKQASK